MSRYCAPKSVLPHRLVPALLCFLLACGTAAAKKKEEYNPFRIPREQFRTTVKTIALRNAGAVSEALEGLTEEPERK